MSTEAATAKEYIFRPYGQDDLNFIQSSWGHSYYKGYSYQYFLNPKEFHLFHRPIRENVLSRPTLAIIVCVSKIDPTLIIGWMMVERPKDYPAIILHYLYVKEAFKGLGIASELIQSSIPKDTNVLYSHSTERAERILKANREKFKKYGYTPHLI